MAIVKCNHNFIQNRFTITIIIIIKKIIKIL